MAVAARLCVRFSCVCVFDICVCVAVAYNLGDIATKLPRLPMDMWKMFLLEVSPMAPAGLPAVAVYLFPFVSKLEREVCEVSRGRWWVCVRERAVVCGCLCG